MGVDIISPPAGNEDRPFGKRGILRAYLTSAHPPVPEGSSIVRILTGDKHFTGLDDVVQIQFSRRRDPL